MDAIDNPRFGLGRFGRPLWSARARDAERIRQALRDGGHREWDVGHSSPGFAVEGAGLGPGEEFLVASAADGPMNSADVRGYEATLRTAGYRVDHDPDDDGALRVWTAGR
jgi:hypothetical protein